MSGRVLLDAAAGFVLNVCVFLLRLFAWTLQWSFATLFFIAVMGIAGYVVFIQAVEGGAYVRVPNVTGMQLTEAYTTLVEHGLEVGEPTEVLNQDRPRNEVVAQRPPADKVVRTGRKVFPTVSVGPDVEPAPSLIGQKLEEALSSVARRGRFQLNKQTANMPHAAPRDMIIGQEPPPGKPMPRGAAITVLVSSGDTRSASLMRNLVGLPVGEAQRLLERMGVKPVVVYANDPRAPYDEVLEQGKAPGTLVAEGEEVEILARLSRYREDVWRQVSIDYTIPEGMYEQEVRIELTTAKGESYTLFPQSQDYSGDRPPAFDAGQRVVNAEGKRPQFSFQDQVTVDIFLDGRRVRSLFYEGNAEPSATDYPMRQG